MRDDSTLRVYGRPRCGGLPSALLLVADLFHHFFRDRLPDLEKSLPGIGFQPLEPLRDVADVEMIEAEILLSELLPRKRRCHRRAGAGARRISGYRRRAFAVAQVI